MGGVGYPVIPVPLVFSDIMSKVFNKNPVTSLDPTLDSTVMARIGTKINLTSKLTAVLSGHGKTNAYLYRFNLREDAKCICDKDDQTMDHILFHCIETRKQRVRIKLHLSKQKNWPANKRELITKHRKVFGEFIEFIDFDRLQKSDK